MVEVVASGGRFSGGGISAVNGQSSRNLRPHRELGQAEVEDLGVTSGTLQRAEEEGTRIFRKAGVEVAWLECGISHSAEAQVPPCQTPLNAITVNLRVLPPSMAERFPSSLDEMGFAIVSARAGSASYAWVFYQRVEDVAVQGLALIRMNLCESATHNGPLGTVLALVAAYGIQQSKRFESSFES
jgi:hypothetical protein